MKGTNYWLELQQQQTTEGITLELSRQINLLGTSLGEIVAENASPELLSLVEKLREQCKQAEQDHSVALLQDIAQTLAALPLEQITWLLRVYTLFFQLVNQAEVQEMIRINHQRELQATPDAPRKESIQAAILALKNAGYSYQQTLAHLQQCDLQFTLTAHPTETRRHTVLEKQQRIGEDLEKLNQPLSQQQQTQVLANLRTEITLLLYTDNIRSHRVTVEDEVRNGIYYLTQVIWAGVPGIYQDLQYALQLYYGVAPEQLPIIVRYRSWIGADGDGNPNINAHVIQATLMQQTKAALTNYITALAQLQMELSISDKKLPTAKILQDSLQQDYQLIEKRFNETDISIHEAYRLKLQAMQVKLEAKLAVLNDTATGLQKTIAEQVTADIFLADVQILQQSLHDSGLTPDPRLTALQIQVNTFGLHLAALDLRQHSGIHLKAVSDILAILSICPDYAALPEPEKINLLQKTCADSSVQLPELAKLATSTQDLLAIFAVLQAAPKGAMGTYIISMTHHLSDMLAVLLLARLTGSVCFGTTDSSSLDIIPLFETIDDLDRIDALLTAMFTDPLYARQLKARTQFQEILLGYSDSNKDGGYWAANYLLHQAQVKVASICAKYQVQYRVFHGRGGSTGRGGGRVYESILAAPLVSQNGRIRVTEQGEVISFHYQNIAMAQRHYEQTLSALLLAPITQKNALQWTELAAPTKQQLQILTEQSRQTYRHLIEDPDFWSWYIQITPIEFISKLPIASRPVMRKAANEVEFADLRAIPWVFSWSQTRLNVPGWFGIGAALQQLFAQDKAALTQLQQLYRDWEFFKLIIDNIQQEMMKAHFLIAQFYNELAPNRKLFKVLIDDFTAAQQAILTITQAEKLLENNRLLQKSIALRNPYTDVLNLLQVELMKCHHAEPDKAVFELPLLLSLNGLAAALQSTG